MSAKKSQGVQRIHWCFRMNADRDLPYTDEAREEEVQTIISRMIDYVEAFAFQLESAPDTGYPHYQGFMQFLNRRRKTWILKNIHAYEYIAPMKGTPKQAWTYNTKEETRLLGPWTLGQPAVLELKVKLEEFVAACKDQKSDIELWDNFPSHMARYHHVPDRIRGLNKPIRMNDLEVYVFYGPPGTGKSFMARELFPDIYVLPFSQKVWLTCRGNLAKEVLFEDFSGEMYLKQFNRLLDRYPEEVEKKGGHLWYMPDVVIITTNVVPTSWYKMEGRQEVMGQVLRRITRCYDFTGYTIQHWTERREMPPALSAEGLCEKYSSLLRPLQPYDGNHQKHNFNQNFIGLN